MNNCSPTEIKSYSFTGGGVIIILAEAGCKIANYNLEILHIL